jgi:hypothetical protein
MYIYLYVSGRSVRLFRPGPKPIDGDRFLFSFRDRCETENAGIYTQMKIAGHPAQHAHTRMQTQTRKHSTKAGLARPYYHFFIFYISISLFVLSLLFFSFSHWFVSSPPPKVIGAFHHHLLICKSIGQKKKKRKEKKGEITQK